MLNFCVCVIKVQIKEYDELRMKFPRGKKKTKKIVAVCCEMRSLGQLASERTRGTFLSQSHEVQLLVLNVQTKEKAMSEFSNSAY